MWAKGTVGYQIFPERYSNGDPDNDPEVVEKWSGLPSRTNFFGGDLRGIINKFNYIKDLNIGVIYLTPIFYAPSNHKYDTIDYFTIDLSFGKIEDLRKLVKLCHDNDIKLVLDGVFNHIGYYSHQFQDVINKGRASRYWDWFYIYGENIDTDIVNYECVGYYKWMPKLNYSSKEVREYFLNVGEYWIKEAGIDGWRLDVADEVDFTFWQEFRKRIKSIDKNILLIGETWKNGIDMLRGDELDTIMNYRFRDAVIDYFAERTIGNKTFADRIESILFDYPYAAHNILYNLLDSHDTARFLTICKGDLNKLKLAVAFQMTFPGMPFVYYGDEIGMAGDTDPDCRRTMSWDSSNNEILEFYKKIINLRSCSNALKYGGFKHINTNSEIYSFIRAYEDEAAIVLINNSEKDNQLSLDSQQFYDNKIFEILHEGNMEKESAAGAEKFMVHLPAGHFEVITLIKRKGGEASSSNGEL
jgi:glycosidase